MDFVSVLVVDNFEPFRQFLLSHLRQRSDLQVVGQAADGLDAVRQAANLQPDVVLLDIGLPRLHGLEAANRIRQSSPQARIVFVSQECAFGLADEVMRIGAWGYVHKQRVHRELLPAIDAALGGTRFFSGCLVHKAAGDDSFQHEAQFYSDERNFSDGLADLVHSALKRGERALVVATGKHRSSLVRRFPDFAIDLLSAQEERRLILLDAAETLARILVKGMPDSAQFSEIIGPLVSTANKDRTSGGPRVTVFGEMVALLWADGSYQATNRLEQLWNELALRHRFSLHCAYPIDALYNPHNRELIMSVCRLHSMVCSI